jgi:hypothetical protein
MVIFGNKNNTFIIIIFMIGVFGKERQMFYGIPAGP